MKSDRLYIEFKSAVLYYLFFSFFITIFLITKQSLSVQYGFNILDIFILITGIICSKTFFQQNDYSWNVFLLFLLFIFCFFSLIHGTHINSSILYIKIFLLFIFFKVYTFEKKMIVEFLNNTYALYVFVSMIVYFFLPNTLYPLQDHFENYVEIGPVKYLVFHSVEGGASTIDSYSALILVCNLFLIDKKTTYNRFFILLSIIMIIYSLKMTPVFALLLSLNSFVLIRNKYVAIIFIIFILTIFITVISYLFIDPIISGGIHFSSIIYAATHARSMIWVQQLEIFFNTYTVKDYIFGNYTSDLFSVKVFQLNGFEKNETYSNPHNTYLLLLYKAPVLLFIYYINYLKLIFTGFERKSFVIISFISIACLSNSSLISLGNPVYIIIITYLLSRKNQSFESTSNN